MLHVDIPTRAEIERLNAVRDPACVSIYLPTTPLTQDVQADRIAYGNLVRAALEQLRSTDQARGVVESMEEALADIGDDDDFWSAQARSLAVLATSSSIVTYRLPNMLVERVEVADRLFVKPLLRAITVGQSAIVLALSQGGVRVVEVSEDMPAAAVRVPDMPTDIASHARKASILDRSPSNAIQGSEGQKTRMRQYARAVDAALRDLLAGRDVPLILAATAPLDAIFRSVCSYPHLAAAAIDGNPDTTSDADLAAAARGVLDGLHAQEMAELRELFAVREEQGRATTDIANAARAATFGAVAVLVVDIEEIVPGTVDEDGAVAFADAEGADSYGVVDEIASRALATGARVLGVRRDEIPGGGSLAAILRYAL